MVHYRASLCLHPRGCRAYAPPIDRANRRYREHSGGNKDTGGSVTSKPEDSRSLSFYRSTPRQKIWDIRDCALSVLGGLFRCQLITSHFKATLWLLMRCEAALISGGPQHRSTFFYRPLSGAGDRSLFVVVAHFSRPIRPRQAHFEAIRHVRIK